MARPKNEQKIIQEEEITQVEISKPITNLADEGIYILYDTKTLDKEGRATKIELKTFETAKNLLVNNSYRYEAREAREFWEQNLTQTEKQVMTIKFKKAEMRSKEIELGNLKQTR